MLEIQWDRRDDHLTFSPPVMVHSQGEESKRKMLSTAFHICDLIACLELFTDEFLPEQWSFREGAVDALEARAARPVKDPPSTRARTACTWLSEAPGDPSVLRCVREGIWRCGILTH
ncbi:hypothetical protein Tsp_04875 [Trichinella spiralis]|nr:hypothetical protein Tsp_04875 [Trichinella spiralis]